MDLDFFCIPGLITINWDGGRIKNDRHWLKNYFRYCFFGKIYSKIYIMALLKGK